MAHEKPNLPYPSLRKRDFLCGIFLIIPLCKGGTERGIFCCSSALLLYCSAALLLLSRFTPSRLHASRFTKNQISPTPL